MLAAGHASRARIAAVSPGVFASSASSSSRPTPEENTVCYRRSKVMRIVIVPKTVKTQWFSTFSLEAAKSRLTTFLEGHTKQILTQVNWHVVFYCRTKSFTENIRGVIERLLRAAQTVLESRKRWEPLANKVRQNLINTVVVTCRFCHSSVDLGEVLGPQSWTSPPLSSYRPT